MRIDEIETILAFDSTHSRMLPFDWKTPFGYFVAWLSEISGCFATYAVEIPLNSLIFASSWLLITINDDLTQELAAFNDDLKTLNKSDHLELVRRFCDIIQLYSDAKE